MLEVCNVSEVALYVLCLVLVHYWLRSLSKNLLKYDPSRYWAENAFLESCLLFVHNTFYRVPYLLYAALDSIKINPGIYLAWGFVVLSLVIFFFFMQIKLRTKPNNDRNCVVIKSENEIVENTSEDFLQSESQPVQAYRSVESALLDIIIILSILSSTLNLLCERMHTGFLYSFPDLLYITHLGFLVKKKLFRTDVTYFYWIGYVGFVLVAWGLAKTFFKCMLRQLLLELYSNVWIIYLTTAFAACRKFDRAFAKDLRFLGKFVVLLGIICLINILPVYKRTIVVLLID